MNGRQVRDPETPVRLEHDHIAVDDTPVRETSKIYLAMNKPRGVVTTAFDEEGRATVYDLLPATIAPADPRSKTPEATKSISTGWVSPVGRLDKASEGLLLFTNDSTWAARITDPDRHLEKRYHVQVDCVAEEDLLKRIGRGVRVDGEHLTVRAVRAVRAGRKNSWLEISLDEGRNRHIRRLLETLGVQVLRLVRVSIGSLELGSLTKGAVRPLTEEEKLFIDKALDDGRVAGKHDGRVPRNVG